MGTQSYHWEGGRQGTLSIEALHAAGVPVRFEPDTRNLLLFNTSKGATEMVRPGEHIVEAHIGWARSPVEHEPTDVAQRGPGELLERITLNPLPGLARLHFERAGYRRFDPEAIGWTYREDGLSIREAHAGEWEPLYVARGEA
jgi:hypothetical protein